jgi:hypothetical protein
MAPGTPLGRADPSRNDLGEYTMEAKANLGNRALWPLAVLLVAALLLVGLTSSASGRWRQQSHRR